MDSAHSLLSSQDFTRYEWLNGQSNQEGAMLAREMIDQKRLDVEFRRAADQVSFVAVDARVVQFLSESSANPDCRGWTSHVPQNSNDIVRLAALTDVSPMIVAIAENLRDNAFPDDNEAVVITRATLRFRIRNNLLVNRRQLTSTEWLNGAACSAYDGEATDEEDITERNVLVGRDGDVLDDVWVQRSLLRNVVNAFFRLFRLDNVFAVERLVAQSRSYVNASSTARAAIDRAFGEWHSIRNALHSQDPAFDQTSLHSALTTVTLETFFDHVYCQSNWSARECRAISQTFCDVSTELPRGTMCVLHRVMVSR